MALQQQRHEFLVARPARATPQNISSRLPMQRSVAVAVAQKEVGTAIDEQLRGRSGVATAGGHQCRRAVHEGERTLRKEVGGAINVDAVVERTGNGGDVTG